VAMVSSRIAERHKSQYTPAVRAEVYDCSGRRQETLVASTNHVTHDGVNVCMYVWWCLAAATDTQYRAENPRQQFPRSILTSHPRWHARRYARHPREDATMMSRASGVSGDFPVQLATPLPDWSSGGLPQCSAARLSVCRVVL